MKAIIFIVTIIFLAGCGTQKNSASLKDEPSDSTKKYTVKKILIVGSGSVASRVFLENLSEDMSSVLNAAGVKSNYMFMENRKQDTQLDSRMLDSLDYDAFILFRPFGKDTLIMTNVLLLGPAPNVYKQKFGVKAFVKTNKSKPVWETSFTADFDLKDKEKYKPITNDIIGTLYIHYFSSQ